MTSTSVIGVAAVAAALVLAGCGPGQDTASSSSCDRTVTLDQYKIQTCGPLRLAVFLPGTNNADLQSRVTYLKSAIPKIPDAKMTIFDAKFDVNNQASQIQNALQSKKYNAAIAGAMDGNLMCNALSKQAPAAGVLVVIPNLAICGRTANEGDQLRAPGTLAFVGGTQSPQYWADYLTWIAKRLTGPTRFLALTDPPAPFPLTANFLTALAKVQATYPNLKVVGSAPTDLTVSGSFQKMQALIQAHPEANAVITMYSSETQGAYQAIKASGKLGRFKIYDKGATPWAVAALKAGEIEATAAERPVTSTEAALAAIVDARAGKKVPAFIGNDGAPVPPGAPPSGFVPIVKATVGTYAGQG